MIKKFIDIVTYVPLLLFGIFYIFFIVGLVSIEVLLRTIGILPKVTGDINSKIWLEVVGEID